jgi:DNA helicase-2/ATP-dependent DNA helicase PcrA
MGVRDGRGYGVAKQLAHKPDSFQQQAIDSTARGIRIVAPAGSGKSETLARRVAKRIEKDGVDPRRILVLTFDNSAKKSLGDFFGQMLDRRQMPQIRTFHGHGLNILKNYFPDENTTLVTSRVPDEIKALRRSMDARGYEYGALSWDGVPRKLTEVFAALKEQGYYPDQEADRQTQWLRNEYLRLPREGESASLDDFWGMPTATPQDDSYATQISSILADFSEFEQEMRAAGMMDYVDQKARPVQQLRRSTSACKRLQSEFDEIVVDETQDISRLDAMLAYYTAGPETLVVLAGDDDQTLYEWRNAHSLYLRHPEIVFKDIEFETIHLNLNYRSPQEILGPAVKLISHNVERIEKSPSSGVHSAGELLVKPAPSPRAHEIELVQGIKDEIAAGTNPEDIAILCHPRDARLMEQPLARMLEREGIPVVEVDRSEQMARKGVWIRSFHKAKGRQWNVVFIPDISDRDLPDSDSIRKEEVESVRRRFYVAMTRARRKLVLSYVRGGDVDRIDYTAEGVVVSTNGASRFLFEAGVVQAAPEPVTDTPVDAPDVAPAPVEPEPVNPEPHPTPIPEPVAVQPAPPSPVPPPVKKGRLKDWEPRAEDTRKLTKARAEWDSGDYDTAILCAWKPLENALKRMVKFPPGTQSPDIVAAIDEAMVQRVIDMAWKDRLHLWRRVRNQAIHDNPQKAQFSPEQFKTHGFQLVDGAGEFFVHLAERNAPKQMVMETQDEFLVRLTNLVTMIQMDKPLPRRQRPIRAIRFDPEQNHLDILAMQLLMVLRDVRFYVPDEYRWSSSPIVSRYTVEAVGHIPANFRTRSDNRLKLQPGEQLNQLLARFDQMVQQECGTMEPGVFITQRLEDGLALGNGNFHAGLKLNPKGKV